MCFHQKVRCVCGKEEAYIFHRDNILPEEVVIEVFCPQCSSKARWNPSEMIKDGGWIIHYDMEIAEYFFKQKKIPYTLSPEFIFDREYCSWYGLSPHDIEENKRLTEEIAALHHASLKDYYEAFRKRRIERVKELQKLGFRKAMDAR